MQQTQSTVQPRFFVIVAAFLAIVFCVLLIISNHFYRENTLLVAQAQSTLDSLTELAEEKQETLTYRQSDAYVERVARDELDMLMPGEYRYTEY